MFWPEIIQLYPGKVVAIIEPRIRGVIVESQNLLITTSEPFIPVPTTEASSTFNELPPYDIENETDIKSFHFETTDFQFKYTVPTVDLCPGSFCDGQYTKENVCLRREKWWVVLHEPVSEWLVGSNHQKLKKNHLLRFTNSTLWPSIRLLSHCRNRRYDSDTPDHSRHHHRSDEFSVTKKCHFLVLRLRIF